MSFWTNFNHQIPHFILFCIKSFDPPYKILSTRSSTRPRSSILTIHKSRTSDQRSEGIGRMLVVLYFYYSLESYDSFQALQIIKFEGVLYFYEQRHMITIFYPSIMFANRKFFQILDCIFL